MATPFLDKLRLPFGHTTHTPSLLTQESKTSNSSTGWKDHRGRPLDLGEAIIISLPEPEEPVRESHWRPVSLVRPLTEHQQLLYDLLLALNRSNHVTQDVSEPLERIPEEPEMDVGVPRDNSHGDGLSTQSSYHEPLSMGVTPDARETKAENYIAESHDTSLRGHSTLGSEVHDVEGSKGSLNLVKTVRSINKHGIFRSSIPVSGAMLSHDVRRRESSRSFPNPSPMHSSAFLTPAAGTISFSELPSFQPGSLLSEGPNRFMFMTPNGSMLSSSTFIPFKDTKKTVSKKKNKGNRMFMNQLDLFHLHLTDSIKRRRAESFAHSLFPSGALEPNFETTTPYNAFVLDDPDLKTGKNRTVITLPCFMSSILQYSKPLDIKKEMNEHFKSTHPNVDASLTLSQIRKIKTRLIDIATLQDLELSSVALAYVYFEKLALKGLINKNNRRIVAATCLVLAAKVNDPKEVNYAQLVENTAKVMETTPKEIISREFATYAALDFGLFLTPSEVYPHLHRILDSKDVDMEDIYGLTTFFMGQN